jgi:hypothetical protein
MKEIEVSDEVLEKASKRADAQVNNMFSFTTNGKLYGIIAEEIFLSTYGGILKNTKHFDIEYKGLNLDIKAKSCKDAPEPHYTASVSDYQKKHKSDGYVFYRVRKDCKVVWELGGLLKDDFFSKAEFVPIGTRDGPFLCKVDMWSLPIGGLVTVDKLIVDS